MTPSPKSSLIQEDSHWVYTYKNIIYIYTLYPYHPCMLYLSTWKPHTSTIHVGKYTSPMDGLGHIIICFQSLNLILPRRSMKVWASKRRDLFSAQSSVRGGKIHEFLMNRYPFLGTNISHLREESCSQLFVRGICSMWGSKDLLGSEIQSHFLVFKNQRTCKAWFSLGAFFIFSFAPW